MVNRDLVDGQHVGIVDLALPIGNGCALLVGFVMLTDSYETDASRKTAANCETTKVLVAGWFRTVNRF